MATVTSRQVEHCRICGTPSEPFAQAVVLHRYPVSYYRCGACGFVQTESPYWLDEAYGHALAAADVGALQRNLVFSTLTRAVVEAFFRPDARFLDYGGGYGLFVRLMRDRGYDFRWHDPFAENVLSRGFEADPSDDGFELITASEVFEHFVDPATELERVLRFGRALLFTTLLLPDPAPRPGEWWYYVPETGQHVSLYTREALGSLASRHGLHYATDGVGLHLFSPRPVSNTRFTLVTRGWVARWVCRLRPRKSLIPGDFETMLRRGSGS